MSRNGLVIQAIREGKSFPGEGIKDHMMEATCLGSSQAYFHRPLPKMPGHPR